jgi:hypothetical protein
MRPIFFSGGVDGVIADFAEQLRIAVQVGLMSYGASFATRTVSPACTLAVFSRARSR